MRNLTRILITLSAAFVLVGIALPYYGERYGEHRTSVRAVNGFGQEFDWISSEWDQRGYYLIIVWRVSWISADPYQSNKATREAISLAPWLQPGGQVLQNNSLNRFQRFLLILLTKTLETVPCQFRFAITGLKPRC